MKKYQKRDYINILILLTIIIMYVLITTRFGKYIYGSTVDWDVQHWAIPEYFRELFYQTKDFFTSFAFNVGAGQNIFYLSYYGLFSPIIAISYFLPFIKMVDYIQLISIINVMISGLFFYIWIRKKNTPKLSFFSTLMFIVATPILFHSHRHIMFTSYMPFLILALISVDKYFYNNKRWPLIVTVFLIIMTNYFYSVSSLLVIVLYGIYTYMKINSDRLKISLFLKDGLKFIGMIVIGVLMASVVLIPTLYVILEGRTSTTININLLSLIIPQFKIDSIFYSAYSPGVGAILIICIVNSILSQKKEDKFLAIIYVLVAIFPIFRYILNATMYSDSKVLIPFVPLIVFSITNTISYLLKTKKLEPKKIIIISIIILIYLMDNNDLKYVLLLESSVFLYCIFKMKKNDNYIYLAITIGAFVMIATSINTDSLVSKDMLDDVLTKSYNDKINGLLLNDDNIYRVSNQNYILQTMNRVPDISYYHSQIYSSTSNKYMKEFYYNESGNEINQRSYAKVSASRNIFYNMYMGNKYIIMDDKYDLGLYKEKFDNIYVNEKVLPIAYASSKIMGIEEYSKLEFPYNMEALLKYIIIDEQVKSNYHSNIKETKITGNITQSKDVNLIETKNGYNIDSKNGSIIYKFKKPINDVYIISFNVDKAMSCSKGDITIRINGIKNTLTCDSWKYHNKNYQFKYVISSDEPISTLNIEFSKGNYDISGIKVYEMKYDVLDDVRNGIDELYFDKNNTVGNNMSGRIDVKNDGYLYFSIPYDKGFSVFVDGNKKDYEKVDTAFIGTKIEKGIHDIVIKYEAPYLNLSIIMSKIGIILLVVIIGHDLVQANKRKN